MSHGAEAIPSGLVGDAVVSNKNIFPLPTARPEYTNLGLVQTVWRRGRLGLYDSIRDRREPVTMVKRGKFDTVVLNDAASANHVLKARGYDKSLGLTEFLVPFMGKGQLLSHGPLWSAQQKQALGAFSQPNHQDMLDQMNGTVDGAMQRWAGLAEQKQAIELTREMPLLAFNILLSALFHEPSHDGADDIQKSLGVILDRADRRVSAPFKLRAETVYRIPLLKFKRAREVLFNAASDLITKRQAQLADPAFPYRDDLLSTLSAPIPEGSPFSPEERIQQVLTYLLAGHETTAHSLTFALKYLTENPDVWRNMVEEIDRVLEGKPLTLDKMRDLKYTAAIFDEALRLSPSVSAIPRKAAADDEIPLDDGRVMRIKMGQVVLIVPYNNHRNTDYWQNPDAFRPERFLDGSIIKPGAYEPFALGPRVCIGMRFAKMEALVVLSAIARNFSRVDVINPGAVKPHAAITLRPKDDVYAKATVRPDSRPH
jgi:cytochrome P450